MRAINEIIVHCTATPEGREVTVSDINRWHQERGYDGIGYHFVVDLDGNIHQGRVIERVGAHCKGHNAHSIGVCYVGGLASDGKTPKDTRTIAQRAALEAVLRQLKGQFPKAKIYGHRDFANKACPCFDAQTEYKEL